VPFFTLAFEGATDEPILRRLCAHVGATVLTTYPASGKSKLDAKIPAYNNAARHAPWLVLRDFDHDATCQGALVRALAPQRSEYMCLRLAVRASEAWLLADRQSLSHFLSVRLRDIPTDPETLTNPRETLINVARKSKKRAIREDMVPRSGASRAVGPGYTSRIIEFSSSYWDPAAAAGSSQSLQKCIAAMTELASQLPD
jgi:hypothetical protein